MFLANFILLVWRPLPPCLVQVLILVSDTGIGTGTGIGLVFDI